MSHIAGQHNAVLLYIGIGISSAGENDPTLILLTPRLTLISTLILTLTLTLTILFDMTIF